MAAPAPEAICPPARASRAPRAPRGPGFSRTEDLLICKAWVSASCDSQHGVGQKMTTFMNNIHGYYTTLLVEQERLDSSRLRAAALQPLIGNTAVVAVAETYDRRNPASVFDRFRKVLSPKVMKFIGIEATMEMASGWNEDDFYNACKSAAKARVPKFGNFDDFRACREYLSDKPKYLSFAASEEKRDQKVTRPNGTKRDKKIVENQVLVASVVETLNNNNNNLDIGKAAMFEKFGCAVESMMFSLKKQEELKILELLSTTQKQQWKNSQCELLLEELETKKAMERAKRRKLDIVIPDVASVASDLSSAAATESNDAADGNI